MKSLALSFLALLLFLLPLVTLAQAPSFAWARQAGGTETDYGQCVAVDAAGNSYVAGYFQLTATFGSATLTAAAPGNDVFIAKYDAAGNLLWAEQAGGTGTDEARAIAVDNNGDIYLAGTFEGTATFGSYTLTGSSPFDILIAKYDAAGTVLWANKTGRSFDSSTFLGIAADNSGNSYLCGTFQDSAYFDNTLLYSFGQKDMFLAKYNASGQVVWAKNGGGEFDDYGRAIAVDAAGNSYLTGSYADTATFGNTQLECFSNSSAFTAKYDTNGNLIWAKRAGGSSALDDVFSNGIGVDGAGNTFITGYFRGAMSFDSISLTGTHRLRTFLAKYDPLGNVLWARQAASTGDMMADAIRVDQAGQSYVAGTFNEVATIGSTTLSCNSYSDAFIAKFSATGDALWATASVSANNGQCFGQGIALDAAGNLYLAGSFLSAMDLGPLSVTSHGVYDSFIAKLGTVTGLPEEAGSALSVYPNPFSGSFQLMLSSGEAVVVTLTDVLGRQLHRQLVTQGGPGLPATITPASLPKTGVYLLRVQSAAKTQVLKVATF